MSTSTSSLFRPFQLKSLNLKNRLVMAPMTRSFSPDGVPTEQVARYYRRRAEAEVGLILSEGTVVNRPSSSNDKNIPRFHGEASLAGWKKVIDEVHAAGGKMAPQLWHMGVRPDHPSGWKAPAPLEGPSNRSNGTLVHGVAMDEGAIHATINAFAQAAADAKALGFDAVEVHGAHGYLIDQFFWEPTNDRTDGYGGKTLAQRTRFATEIIRAIRARVGPDFVILLRLSQWKIDDYHYKLAKTPQEMEAWLAPLSEAGVDIFHCSQRRYWEPEFAGSELNFAGWAKKITGKPTITVGSVGLSAEFTSRSSTGTTDIEGLLRRLEKGEFDLVAVGRALLSDAQWVVKLREGRAAEMTGFATEHLKELR